MTLQEAFDELGLDRGASLEEVEIAYRRRAMDTHPDTNRDDPDASKKFQRVKAAKELLKDYLRVVQDSDRARGNDRGHQSRSDRNSHSRGEDAQGSDTVNFVRDYLDENGIVVLADGFLDKINHIRRPRSPAEFHAYLLQLEVSPHNLVDELMLLRDKGMSRSLLAAAVRKVIAADAKARTSVVFTPLLRKLGPTGKALTLDKLCELTSLIFKGPPRLMAYGLQQFVWQVHCKMMGRPVQNHLMPVVWSAAQGTGKSTFVRKLCEPLQELFSPPITMADYIDSRFSDALDYAVLFVDEIPALTPKQVDALKQITTSEDLLRRQPVTSKKVRVRQKSTAIGTANGPVEQYFPDPSGHRRFLSMELVDGRHDERIWAAIDHFDYQRLWRMYDATDTAPILDVLDEMRQYQASKAPLDPLLSWLIDLDPNAPNMKAICKGDGYRSDDLRKNFNGAMRVAFSRQRFSDEMERYFSHDLTPFGSKRTVNGYAYFRLKPK